MPTLLLARWQLLWGSHRAERRAASSTCCPITSCTLPLLPHLRCRWQESKGKWAAYKALRKSMIDQQKRE